MAALNRRGARFVAGGLVREYHLAEPCEGIADVRRVVDRQTTSAAPIDVSKGAVGKLRTRLRAERCHPRMIATPDAQNGDRRARSMAVSNSSRPIRRSRLRTRYAKRSRLLAPGRGAEEPVEGL
jgi:hypothetical protein